VWREPWSAARRRSDFEFCVLVLVSVNASLHCDCYHNEARFSNSAACVYEGWRGRSKVTINPVNLFAASSRAVTLSFKVSLHVDRAAPHDANFKRATLAFWQRRPSLSPGPNRSNTIVLYAYIHIYRETEDSPRAQCENGSTLLDAILHPMQSSKRHAEAKISS
jgi:hypothetical protein